PRIRGLKDLQANRDLYNLTARFEAMPERVFNLTLKEIGTQATSSNTYPVTAVMPKQKDLRILPGMAVTVELEFTGRKTAQDNNKYSVPVTAILNENNNNFIWKYNNGLAEKIQVSAGRINNNAFIEIEPENIDSLHGGDTIITAGVYFLHEGQHVRLLEE
ncbi:MAG: hypothetical protein II917_08700, partial [Synergistaceae bacterium]|nr:hypothetical protein [Synergistaceae bacterium]